MTTVDTAPSALGEPTRRVSRGWITALAGSWLGIATGTFTLVFMLGAVFAFGGALAVSRVRHVR